MKSKICYIIGLLWVIVAIWCVLDYGLLGNLFKTSNRAAKKLLRRGEDVLASEINKVKKIERGLKRKIISSIDKIEDLLLGSGGARVERIWKKKRGIIRDRDACINTAGTDRACLRPFQVTNFAGINTTVSYTIVCPARVPLRVHHGLSGGGGAYRGKMWRHKKAKTLDGSTLCDALTGGNCNKHKTTSRHRGRGGRGGYYGYKSNSRRRFKTVLREFPRLPLVNLPSCARNDTNTTQCSIITRLTQAEQDAGCSIGRILFGSVPNLLQVIAVDPITGNTYQRPVKGVAPVTLVFPNGERLHLTSLEDLMRNDLQINILEINGGGGGNGGGPTLGCDACLQQLFAENSIYNNLLQQFVLNQTRRVLQEAALIANNQTTAYQLLAILDNVICRDVVGICGSDRILVINNATIPLNVTYLVNCPGNSIFLANLTELQPCNGMNNDDCMVEFPTEGFRSIGCRAGQVTVNDEDTIATWYAINGSGETFIVDQSRVIALPSEPFPVYGVLASLTPLQFNITSRPENQYIPPREPAPTFVALSFSDDDGAPV